MPANIKEITRSAIHHIRGVCSKTVDGSMTSGLRTGLDCFGRFIFVFPPGKSLDFLILLA